MNKIFKVVWSKTKECYVVVSEVAKNNSGKKKVLASVLAALAVVGAGAGVSVQAADMNTDTSANTAKQINIWANTKYKGNPAAGGSNAAGTGTANSNNVRPSDYGDEISLAIGNYNVVSSTDTKSPASGGSSYAIGNGNQLKGNRNIAVGTNNKTYGDDSIAMGNQSISGTGHSIAIGSISGNKQTVAYGSQNPSETGPSAFGFALAIGAGAQADGRANSTSGGIAIGQEVTATNTNSIVIGQTSEASGSHAITIGRGSSATSTGAMAFGYSTNATGPASLAIGRQTNAKAYKSVAIGPDSIVNAQRTSSSYEFSGSNGTPSPAGYKTETITVNSGSAPASGPVAGNYYNAGSAVAIGDSASVSDASSGAVVVGPNAKTNGNAHYSVVLGSGSHADASDGFVAGHGSYVESRESIAMGSGANVSGNENIRSQAIGFGATVTGTGAYDATAIGSTAQVSGVQGGVALGSGSLLSRTTNSNENAGWNSKSLNGTAIRNRAYTADLTGNNNQWDSGSINTGAVSVGNDTQKRQIINVAAGSQDTDAVNVAQLKNVGVRVGADTNTATIGTNKVAADFLAYNGQLNIKGDNNRVTTVSENDVNGKDANVNVKFDYDGLVKAKTGSAVTVDQKTDGNGKTYFEIDAAAASKTVLADGKNTTVTGAGTTASPYKVNVEGALTGISSITNNGGGKIEFTTGGTTISGGPVNVSNNKITGVANGDVNATSTDAVNGSQLYAVKAAERHIKPTTTGSEYTVDSNGDVTMTYLDGNNNAVAGEKAVIKGIAKQDLSNITNEGKKEITKLGTIVKAGDNVNVSESSDATTGRTTYTVSAVTPAVYTKADGTKVYKRPDGTFTTNQNLAAGNNVDKGDVITSFMDGNGNTTGGNMVINNVGSAIDKTGTSTGDTFLTKLNTAATNTPNAAVNVRDLKTTSDALVDKGLKFTGNNTGTENTHKLGSLVKVQGEGVAATDVPSFASAAGNIAVVANGTDTLEFKLNKNLKGINSVSNGSSSITLNSNPGGTNNTPAVSITGGNVDVGGNNITNLKSGGDTDSNAANIGDVKKIASDTDTHIKPGTYTVAADKTVTMTYVNGKGETVKANGQDVVAKIDLSGLPTGGTSSTEKVKKAANGANDTNIAEVNPQTGDIYGAADATYEVSVSRNAVKDAAREAVTVNNGGTTTGGTYTADTNNPISVTAAPDNTNHNTTYAVTFDGNKAAKQIPLTYKATNGTTTTADQTVKLDKGLNFTGGDYTTASVGADGKVTFDVNLGTAPTVTDGKPGVPGQAGAAGKDGIATVKTVVDTINNSGWKANAKANGGKLDGTATATIVKPGNTVNYAAGNNLIVKQELETDASNALTGNQTYTYSLNKDIDLTNAGSLTVGDTTVNNGGITIKAPTPAAGTTATTTDVKLTNTGLDNGGNKIVNVANGDVNSTSKDAVNGSQLYTVDQKFNNKINLGADGSTETTKFALDNAGGIKFNIKGDGSGTSGANQYISTTANGSDIKVDLTDDAKAKLNKSYDVTSTDNSVTVKSTTTNGVTTFDLKVAPAAGTTSTWDIKSSADTANGGATATGHEANAKTIENTKTVEMIAGKNLTVKQTSDTNGAKVEFALSDEIAVGKDGANGKDGSVGVTGKDGSSVVINGADGSIGMTGPKGQDGKDGINGRDGANLSMTSAKGEQVLVNRDPAHSADTDKAERIVYVPKDASGNPIQDANGKNIVREVATMDDGLKFTGNNTTIENKQKLGSLVKVQGEGTKEGTTVINTATGEKEIVLSDGTTKFESAKDNIAVVADGTDTLTVKLNKNLAGINKISNGNSSITLNDTPNATTPAVTITGGNLSMGDSTTKNKIVNLAPGTEDSDAVNYKQLKAAKTEVKAGDNVTVKLTTDTTDGHNIYTINAVTPAVYTKADGTKVVKRPDGTYTTNVDGAPGNDVPASDVIISFQDAAGDTKQGNSIVNNVGSAIDKPGTATGNTFLTKLDKAATDTPFAAVNVRDLKTTTDALKATERHIAPTTVPTGSTENKGGTASGGTNVYKYDATSKTVTLTYNDGNGKAVTDTKAVIDFSALNTGGTGASSWNIASDKVSATEGTVAAGSAAAQNIADGKTVTMQAGKNLTVNQTNDAAGNASVAFSLDKDLTNLDKVVVNGKDGIAGKDGVTIVGPQGATGAPGMPGTNGIDGKVGITGKDGKDAVSISGKDGIGTIGLTGPQGPAGQDGRGVDITTDHGTQTLYKPEANNNNQSERIVYVPKDKDGTPLKDTDGNTIKREVATMDDGLKFTGNNTSTENKQKLGSLVKVQGEGTKESTAVDPATGKKYVVLSDGTTKFESAKDNIAVEADGTDTLTVKLNKNLKGLNSIQLGDNTIKSNGDNIEFTTKGGNTKTVATTDQLWTIQANGTDVPAKSGKVNLVAGDHITITPDAANGKMTISATGFGSMDGFNVKSSASTGGTHAGDTTENIKNGKTVDMQAGKNLVVTQTNDGNGNTTVNYALNKDVDLGTTGSLKTGDTTINNDGFKNGNTTVGGNGMTINNPTDPTKTISLTKDGLNNGGNQITNVASGGNVDTNAANIGDIKRLAKDTRIKDGTYTVDNNGTVELTYVDGAGNQVKDASGNAITAKITGLTTLDSTRVNVAVNKTGTGEVAGSTAPVKVTKGTEFVAGNNLIVERKAHTGNDLDNSVVYSLNSNLTGINSISNTATGPKMTFGGNNVNFTGGDVKISNGNLDMNNNKITNVANGTADNDAVNVSQLKAAKTVVKDDGVTTRVTKSTGANGEDVYTVQSLTGGGADLSNITNKVDQLGEEIGRVGAQGAALSALKPIQYDPLEPTQIMAGYGNYRGNSALALGVAHYKNESTLIHGGVSWAGGSSHMMANAGVTWKVGNRDSEAAVADRYRKGPISSAYAMQQEMASVKAQNAGLKSEVSDLKAENEQMKAQIAAMMAKLGM